MNRSVLIYNLKRVFESKAQLVRDVSKKTINHFCCSKRGDFAVSADAKWLVGRRIKKNLTWEIVKESVDHKQFDVFPRLHKHIITCVDLVCNERFVLSIGENGLVVLFDFNSLRQHSKLELGLSKILSSCVLGNLAVIGGRGGFEFVYLNKLKYVNYRNPHKNKFNRFMDNLRGKKDQAQPSAKVPFKCEVIRTLKFGLDGAHSSVLIFGGSYSHFLTRVDLTGPFAFLEEKIKKDAMPRRSSRLCSKSISRKRNSSQNGSMSKISKKMSFTSLFSFNQAEPELKKVSGRLTGGKRRAEEQEQTAGKENRAIQARNKDLARASADPLELLGNQNRGPVEPSIGRAQAEVRGLVAAVPGNAAPGGLQAKVRR